MKGGWSPPHGSGAMGTRLRSRSVEANRRAQSLASAQPPSHRSEVASLRSQVDQLTNLVQRLTVGLQQGNVPQFVPGPPQTPPPAAPWQGQTPAPTVVQTPPPRVQPGSDMFSPPGISTDGPSAAGFFETPPVVQPAASDGRGSQRSMEVDQGSGNLSRADKWLSPIEKPKVWKGRMEEIIGF